MGRAYRTHETEVDNKFRGENLNEGDHCEELDIDGAIILKWTLKKYNRRLSAELIWLRTETTGELLRAR
jgi:hypothetical protein